MYKDKTEKRRKRVTLYPVVTSYNVEIVDRVTDRTTIHEFIYDLCIYSSSKLWTSDHQSYEVRIVQHPRVYIRLMYLFFIKVMNNLRTDPPLQEIEEFTFLHLSNIKDVLTTLHILIG